MSDHIVKPAAEFFFIEYNYNNSYSDDHMILDKDHTDFLLESKTG